MATPPHDQNPNGPKPEDTSATSPGYMQALRQVSLEAVVAFRLAHLSAEKLRDFLRDHMCDRKGHEEDRCPCCDQSTAPFCPQCEVFALTEGLYIEGIDESLSLDGAAALIMEYTPWGYFPDRPITLILAEVQAKLVAKQLEANS